MQSKLYETDFYGWTQQQAAILKAGKLSDLDVMNLMEEIESMGGSERRELEGVSLDIEIYGHSRFCNTDFRRYHWLA